jgi:hypothetical protein
VPSVTLCGAGFFYYKLTDGFNMKQISAPLPPDLFYKTELTPDMRLELQAALSQPFRYMGKGCQFYAFESQDGRFVLKFFKKKHLASPRYFNSLPAWLIREKVKQRKDRVRQLFNSCRLAYEDFKEESGLLYIHLDHSIVLEKELVLIDKMGFSHPIYLDDFEFLLQRRGVPMGHLFSQRFSEAEMREKISLLTTALSERIQKGVIDEDRAVAQNMVFLPEENRFLFVDVGQLRKREGWVGDKELKVELSSRMKNFRVWAENHLPTLLPYIDEEIGRINSSS